MSKRGRLRFKMYGVATPGMNDSVSARAFSKKLSILLAALGAADRAVNDKVMYDYAIVRAQASSMDLEIAEYIRPKFRVMPNEPSIAAFQNCISAVASGESEAAKHYGKCTQFVNQLAQGAGAIFGYAELWANDSDAYRVDKVLEDQALSVIKPSIALTPKDDQWFSGFVHCEMDGFLKEVDLRGSLPQGKLILSAGGKEIDCIFRGVTAEEIRDSLDRRVKVQGRAFYDGYSGLPRRIDVRSAPRILKENVDFSKWRGAFKPFTPLAWDEDN